MTKPLAIVCLALAAAAVSPAVGHAQDRNAITPIKVQVVISRYQGEKKVSSNPYTLSVNASPIGVNDWGRANLRMGSKIPVMMMAPVQVAGKPVTDLPTTGPIQYQDVGTNIDCMARTLEDGRFRLEISIDDSSVYPDDQHIAGGSKGNPSFRSFRASDSVVLKDGGTAQFTAAVDKVTGEVVRVEVTLNVVK